MNKYITILYVEDEDNIRAGISRVLKRLCDELYLASNGLEGLELFKTHKPDIIVSDIRMPYMDGIEMCRKIKEIDKKQHIIFTTAHTDSDFFMKAIEMHVDGYVLKPIDFEKLEENIEDSKDRIFMKRYYIEHKKELEIKAYLDSLTQVYNRTYFEQEYTKMLDSCVEDNLTLSLVMLDIDKFKNINDTYGHLKGDEILKQLAKIIKQNIRKNDIFARWGGEEFIIIAEDTILKDALHLAENLRKSIKNSSFIDGIEVTCSFGVAEFDEKFTAKDFMQKVDDLLYLAKKNGRDRVES